MPKLTTDFDSLQLALEADPENWGRYAAIADWLEENGTEEQRPLILAYRLCWALQIRPQFGDHFWRFFCSENEVIRQRGLYTYAEEINRENSGTFLLSMGRVARAIERYLADGNNSLQFTPGEWPPSSLPPIAADTGPKEMYES